MNPISIFESQMPLKVEEIYDFGPNMYLINAKHSADELDTWYTMDKKTNDISHLIIENNMNAFLNALSKPQLQF